MAKCRGLSRSRIARRCYVFFWHLLNVFATAALVAPLAVGRAVLLRLTVARGRVAECCLKPTLGAIGVQILTPPPSGGQERGAARRAECQAASLRAGKEQLDRECANQTVATELHLRIAGAPLQAWPDTGHAQPLIEDPGHNLALELSRRPRRALEREPT